ncbi:MAG: hypothetical protein CFH41_02402 [Alphaproteobacteria bacterium MarineAlpha11_Bin1]|nr:MAG: hypothetical protein CFH41_02402 [Alphaproteobacteria bacterium MarineAlpha11_Bin1]|tara:strand:+ start:6531 stop:6836 length:306 start_codon:yes stop_codon:yes gene_type:complete
MQVSFDDNIALFIDSPNPYACSKSHDFEFDYETLLQIYRRSVRAYYYNTLTGNQEYPQIAPLIDCSVYNGSTTGIKSAWTCVDAGDRRRYEANISVELVVN